MFGASRVRLRGFGSPQRGRRTLFLQEWLFTPGDSIDQVSFLTPNLALTNFVALWNSSGRGAVARSTRGQALVASTSSVGGIARTDPPVAEQTFLPDEVEPAPRPRRFRIDTKVAAVCCSLLVLAGAAIVGAQSQDPIKVALVPVLENHTNPPKQAFVADCARPFEVGASLDARLPVGTFRPIHFELGGVRIRTFDSLCGGAKRSFQIVEVKTKRGWLIEKVANLSK